jgi:lysophospholipase L1-like esterase
MKTRRSPLAVWFALGLTLVLGAPAAPATTPALPRFQEAIDAFQAADRAQPPPRGGILFVGSSIFRQWTTVAEQMAPLPVTNRAFGGSRTQDQLDRFEQVVLPCAPRVIVYYCGSNDLKAEAPDDPAVIFARFRQFSERARAALPGVRIVFVSSNRSLDRVPRWTQVDHYNALARAYCAATPGHTFIDINPALVDANGQPRVELYRDDRLHFHPPAYVEFTRIIKPVLTDLWSQVTANEPAGAAERAEWVRWLDKIARPVLIAASRQRLHTDLPVAPGTEKRVPFASLEAVGRLLSGLAPWLESDHAVPAAEAALRSEFRPLALQAIANLTDPASPDRVNAGAGSQILVDTAFLAEAFLRAPQQLWAKLSPDTQSRVVALMVATRQIKPGQNNWILFSATIEAFLGRQGLAWEPARIDYALRQMDEWYKGDGYYGDGPEFHFDYYNSIVMQPMLLDVLAAVGDRENWTAADFPARMLTRAQRHAALLERQISPEGALPPVGRSLAYRCGVLHGLAQMALLEKLPTPVAPAQVRGAMTAAMRRLLDAPGVFDEAGWLRIGFAGAQPGIGENYISTGSLYLCAAAFLPLGLPPENAFWRDPAALWTSQQAYLGKDLPADHALRTPAAKK